MGTSMGGEEAPVLTPIAVWGAFHSALKALLDRPLQGPSESLFAVFRDWVRDALAALLQNPPEDWTDGKTLRREHELLLLEMHAFAAYQKKRYESLDQAAARVDDSVEQEESCSIASTVLDSLMKAFPQLAGLWQACKEASDIKKALIRGNRR